MTLRREVEALLNADPKVAIRLELADDASLGRKQEYISVYDHDGRELLMLDRETLDQLVRDGVVRAGPLNSEQRSYTFYQTAEN